MDKPEDKQSENSAVPKGKNSKKTTVIINPPEKGPLINVNELFKNALDKHAVAINAKTSIVLEAKAAQAGIDTSIVERVFVRGYKNLPLNTTLTREQYAMNRVNSFVAGGAAMEEDCDLLPILERIGLKGSGGAMRPHIKRERNPYNNKVTYHVVDSRGVIKHSTSDEFEARKHLAQKYRTYMEGVVSPLKRLIGTDSLVRVYKKDTPGEQKEEKKMKGSDPCWDDYEMVGHKMKNGRKVPNCVPKNEEVELPDNTTRKLKTITKQLDKSTKTHHKQSVLIKKLVAKDEKDVAENVMEAKKKFGYEAINARFKQLTGSSLEDRAKHYDELTAKLKKQEAEYKAQQNKPVKEQAEDINERFKTAAWSRKEGKNPEGGLNRKGIASYRARNPGSKLSMAVTTKPSKLDPDSKAAKRRKSFCARMGGVEGPMKKPNGEPTRKALALRKWNC